MNRNRRNVEEVKSEGYSAITENLLLILLCYSLNYNLYTYIYSSHMSV